MKVTVAGHSGDEIIKCSRDGLLKPEVALTEAKKVRHKSFDNFKVDRMDLLIDCIELLFLNFFSQEKYDMVIIPGGYHSAEAFCKSELIGEVLKAQEAANGLIAANCSAPLALAAHKIYPGKSVTGFPSLRDRLNENFVYQDMKDTFEDGNVITGRGPGQSIIFGLKCAEALVGFDTTKKVAKDLLLDYQKSS